MTHAKQWLGGVGASVLFVVGAVACADMGSDLFPDRPSSAAGSDSDGGLGGKATAPSNSSELAPTDNGVILVHAAGASSFRLCFENAFDDLPTPDAELMPQANVVGVEVGSAVRIAPLKGAPGDVYLFSEPLIRHLYSGGATGSSCRTLVEHNVPSTLIGNIKENLTAGVHLLVVRGCAQKSPVRTYTVAECGSSYKDDTGNLSATALELKGTRRAPITEKASELPAQVLHLSQSLESFRGERKLSVTFGDIVTAGATHTSIAPNPTLGGPPVDFKVSPTFDPSDTGIYTKLGFRVMLDEAEVAKQTMASVQVLSAPRDVPTSYYAVASNYVFLMLGDPTLNLADGGPDDRRQLHLLAVPVIEPKDETDAGSPSGVDGGI